MPITRTAMVDDDGSGTTGTILNNAWKQELYNQIDTLVGPVQTWTPVDASGAGLTLGTAIGHYTKHGQMVFVTGYVAYPATTNGALAKIGGLPFPAFTRAGLTPAYGANTSGAMMYFIDSGTTIINLLYAPTSAYIANLQVTGTTLMFSGCYLTN
jgi:hypothetical protein